MVGRAAVRDYRQGQWGQINRAVEPETITERADRLIEVRVHQTFRDQSGTLVSSEHVPHLYRFTGDLFAAVDIRRA